MRGKRRASRYACRRTMLMYRSANLRGRGPSGSRLLSHAPFVAASKLRTTGVRATRFSLGNKCPCARRASTISASVGVTCRPGVRSSSASYLHRQAIAQSPAPRIAFDKRDRVRFELRRCDAAFRSTRSPRSAAPSDRQNFDEGIASGETHAPPIPSAGDLPFFREETSTGPLYVRTSASPRLIA